MAINLFAIHGILQILTFVVLFPLGALIALFREVVGNNWFILHVTIQTFASILVFIALIIINIAIKNRESKEAKDTDSKDSNKKPSLHLIIGSIIVCLIVFQLIWATTLRHIIPRPIWYYIHILTAISIILLGWVNLYYGSRHYRNLRKD